MLAVTFVSGNENKARQVRAILGDAVALTHTHLDLVEVQGSVAEIAVAKCRQAAGLLGGPVLVEDTALAFDALNGLPGPYVRPFLDAVGCEGLVGMLAGFSEKGAAAICTFAYAASASAEPILFQGVTRGTIVQPRGPTTFGWDAIFEPDHESRLTYAEMPAATKNTISHRAKALALFMAHLEGGAASCQ